MFRLFPVREFDWNLYKIFDGDSFDYRKVTSDLTTGVSSLSHSFNTDEKGLTCEVELPGIPKDKVQVTVQDATHLHVKVEKVGKYEEQSFRIRVGKDYDVKKTTCKMQDGVLTVSVPVLAAEEKPTLTIPVE